jgi:predicted TIM-barrel fold metal-dependent hydrolase
MAIDAHAHVGDFTGFIRGGYRTPDELVSLWDEAGVECGLISVLIREDMTRANEITREASERFVGRIYGYVYLNPTDVEGAIREVERCAETECFRGVKFHPQNDVYYPFYEGYYPVYEKVQELGLPTLWHTGTYPYTSPLQVAYVARLFPRIPFVLAHFALADLSWECFPAATLSDNVHFDMTANPIIPLLDEWIEKFGAERMLWGSDFPFYSVPYERLKVDYLACSEAEKELILSGNARRLFRL